MSSSATADRFPSAARPSRTLHEISAHWRVALFAAQDALAAVRLGGTSVAMDPAELGAFERSLAAERVTTTRLLEAVANEEHIVLHPSLSGPRATARTVGLPIGVRACLFDLDGVLTASAEIHAAAWRDSLNDFLSRRLERTGERFGPFRPFSTRRDYYRYIHGKPRVVGLRAFLASRGIKLEDGRPEDPVQTETVFGLANRKTEAFQRLVERKGIRAYGGTARYLQAVREAGLRCAVISASANTATILQRSGLAPMIDRVVDGNVIRKQDLEGKPAPDTIIAACELLGIRPGDAVAFETTVDGVEAAGNANVALIVGVERVGLPGLLGEHGADCVVPDLSDLLDPQP
jgi:beta-phosphoglucomutase-like phosphatase (HAD superfamily)